jgi:hypothetical protein
MIHVPKRLRGTLGPRRQSGWPFWLKVLVATAVVFLLAALGTWWTDERGHFPAWLAALATTAALIAAIFAARYAARAFALEAQREDHRIEADRTSQASLIAAWVGEKAFTEYYEDDDSALAPLIAGPPRFVQGIYLRNASNLPVFTLTATVSVMARDPDTGKQQSEELGREDLAVLPPSTQAVFHRMNYRNDGNLRLAFHKSREQGLEPVCLVRLTFRDSEGATWVRGELGGLTRIVQAPISEAPGALHTVGLRIGARPRVIVGAVGRP